MRRLGLVDVLAKIEAAAPLRDTFDANLAAEIGWLHAAGALVEALPESLTGAAGWSDDPLALTDLLRAVGRASLPVGRVFEGHINTAQLIGLYGSPSLRSRCVDTVRAGGLLGVWGADGAEPVQAEATGPGFRLHGAKVFCSGLGLVETALISASLDGAIHLFAVDVSDARRADHTDWRVSGMRATRSGGYDFEGVELPADARVGGPEAYFVEPYFLGGMYRMCAVQVGGLEALLDAMVVSLRRRGRASQPLSQHRVGSVAAALAAAIAVTERLARMIAAGDDPAVIAREAVLAREAVERRAVEALEIVERSVGTEAHREGTRISLARRDLSFYLRQAAVDERLIGVGAAYLSGCASAS